MVISSVLYNCISKLYLVKKEPFLKIFVTLNLIKLNHYMVLDQDLLGKVLENLYDQFLELPGFHCIFCSW